MLKSDLELYFEPENSGFIKYFFIENTVSCNDFVLFVCFFLFHSNDEILSILLSMIGVTSNILITKEQINKFTKVYNFDNSIYVENLTKIEY